MRVILGISGGVDSAISAYLLKKAGYEVIGIYMWLFNPPPKEKLEYISKKIGFKYYIEDLREEFKKEVFDYFISSYKDGLTPNPCAMCNTKIKFGEFMKFLDKYDASYAATGHYVRCDGEFLYEAKDKKKDQSYFLFGIKKEYLKKLIFPLGDYFKEEIKEIAKEIGLDELAKQKESQDICFINGKYIDLLKEFFDVDLKGIVVNKFNKKVGYHKGYMHYTIGQRKGFSLFKAHKPHYVIAIDAKENKIVVGSKEDLLKKMIFLKGANRFIEDKEFKALIKVRYNAKKVPGIVKFETQSKAYVKLIEPASSVARGQACVFYENEKLLGGGWIKGVK